VKSGRIITSSRRVGGSFNDVAQAADALRLGRRQAKQSVIDFVKRQR
jgi:hypothetical protein